MTAADTILQAALTLTDSGKDEFSEWELSVAAWEIDPIRFGMGGFEDQHPDHKRVFAELTGEKVSNPVRLGQLVRTRPNCFRLTSAGRHAAFSIGRTASLQDWYRTTYSAMCRPQFKRWKANHAEPKRWAEAVQFFDLGIDAPKSHLKRRLKEIREAVRTVGRQCVEADSTSYSPGRRKSGHLYPRITVGDVAELLDFLTAMEFRFPDQLGKAS